MDFKTSLIVNKQVPQFIREDHPKFIAFLEAYYEFLENEQFTLGNSQKNDVTTQLKKLRHISDIDQSLEQFEEHFINSYASLIPKDTAIDKDFLLKNIFPLYNSKGSEKSFRLLFRMLFDQEIQITSPKDNILRASDGKWKVENILRCDPTIESLHTGDGSTTTFNLPQVVSKSDITVLINGAENTNFFVKSEIKKIIFDSAPANNAEIVIRYNNFDIDLLKSRKLTSATSGTTVIIEKVNVRNISGDYYFQIYIDLKTLIGTFKNGEYLLTDIFGNNDELIQIRILTLSQLSDIIVVDRGASYNVGDPVLFVGQSTKEAVAIIDDVESGTLTDVNVLYGGAGFKVTDNIRAVGYDTSVFDGDVITVDATGNNTLNAVTIYTDIISDYANVVISNTNYGFPVIGTENTNTSIINALSTISLTNLGPITSLNISTSQISSLATIYAEPQLVSGNIRLNSIGILGRINVASSGTGYAIGEYLVFTNQPNDFSGRGANAHIANVSISGGISQIKINSGGVGYQQDNLPTITVNTANGTNAILIASDIMGDGELLQGILPKDEFGNDVYAGQIKSIKIIDPGEGYVSSPYADLTLSGNGLATANVLIRDSLQTLQGKWITSDSLLSSDDRKLQGRNYYVNFSYLISSQVEFRQYKNILKQLLHPAGMVGYSEYNLSKVIDTTTEFSTYLSTKKSISGTVNTNSSIYVTGTNTKFILSNTRSVLTPGSNVSINNQIRTVNTILSNTQFTVTSAFTFTANDQILTILT